MFINIMDLEQLKAISSKKKPHMSVVTFNVRLDTSEDGEDSWLHRRHDFVEYMVELNPLIFGLQEPLDHQIKEIAEHLKQYSWFGHGRDDGGREGEFNPIFFKSEEVQLKDSGTFWLSETPHIPGSKFKHSKHPRICTWGFFRWKHTAKGFKPDFYVLNTHLDHIHEWTRSLQVKSIIEFVENYIEEGRLLVLMGDFNCEEDSEPYTLLSSSGLVHDTSKISPCVFPAHTSTGFSCTKKENIDYIWSRGFKVDLHAVMTDARPDKRHYSDHRPVLCQLYPEEQ